MIDKKEHEGEHGTIWVSALRAAAGVARQATSGEDDVIRAVSKELSRLNLRGTVALFNEDGMLIVGSPSLPKPVISALHRITGLSPAGYSFDPHTVALYHRVLESREAQFTPHRSEVVSQLMPDKLKPLLAPVMKILGEEHVILAPLLLGSDVIGTLNVVANWLTPDDVPMVAALADHIAIALGQVRSREKLERALELQRLRNQVIEEVASSRDIRQVFEGVIHLALEVNGADAGAVGLIENDENQFSYPCIIGLPGIDADQVAERNGGFARQLVKSRRPILVPDYSEMPCAIEAWVQSGAHAFLGVPLIIGTEAIGGIGLFSFSSRQRFGSEHIEQVQAIASMAAIAVRNVRLYSEAHRRAEEAQTLMKTARSISSSLDTDTVLNEIARQANDLLNGDGSRIHLVDYVEGTLQCVVALEPNAQALLNYNVPLGQGLTGHVVETGESLLINDPTKDPRAVQVPGTPEDEPECLAIAPLSIRQRTLGAMTVRRLGLERPFTTEELDLLRAFAAQAAVSIENAHLYGQIEAQAQRLERQVEERTRELALSEARYRSLVETAQSGIFQINADGMILYVNRALERMAEAPTEEIVGKHFQETGFLDDENLKASLQRFHSRIIGDLPEAAVYETTFRSNSGREIPAMIGVSLILDDEGRPQGLTGLITDISERITLEEALKAERDRLDAMLTHVGDAVMVTDHDAVIQFVNPAWERLNGYRAEEVLGKTPAFMRTGKQSEDFYKSMQNTIEGGETFKAEVVNLRKDGSTYEAAMTITPVVAPDNSILNYVSVYHDISALKELDRLKSQFVSDVSHELRTPLTNIRLYLDLLERVRDKQKVTRYLETLSRESDRLANLIDDLLSLSRLDVGASPLYARPVDINTLLSALVQDRASLAAERDLQLVLQISEDAPAILADERLLGQVFTNLLTNAMNYTPEGGRITLRSRTHHDGQNQWVIAEVEDTGLGIAPSEQTEIFKRFFRGTASQETGAPGTGLGLAICHEIADRHGGHIHVYSAGHGKGSCFAVWLPVEGPPDALQ
ncbi:MAG: PAS domain S-box protein [Anaerolineales bacterium]